MPQKPKMFLYRVEWLNGDVSYVMARNGYGAMERVDGAGPPAAIERTRTFVAHFTPCAIKQADGKIKMGWFLDTFGPETIEEMPDEATVYRRRKGLEEVMRDPATGRYVKDQVAGPPPKKIVRHKDPVTGRFIHKEKPKDCPNACQRSSNSLHGDNKRIRSAPIWSSCRGA